MNKFNVSLSDPRMYKKPEAVYIRDIAWQRSNGHPQTSRARMC